MLCGGMCRWWDDGGNMNYVGGAVVVVVVGVGVGNW